VPKFKGSRYYDGVNKVVDYHVNYRFSLIGMHYRAEFYIEGRYITDELGTTVWRAVRFPVRRTLEREIREGMDTWGAEKIQERYNENRRGPD